MKREELIRIVILVLAATAGTLGGKYLIDQFSNSTGAIDSQLVSASNEINKNAPIIVDSDTRLDTTAALPGKGFKYLYTLINYAAADIDVPQFKEQMTGPLLKNIKTNPDLKVFRDKGVTMHYSYRDKDGNSITEFVFAPEDYK